MYGLCSGFAKSVKNQKLILEGEHLPVVDKSRFTDNAKVIVSTKRTFEAASSYGEQKRVAKAKKKTNQNRKMLRKDVGVGVKASAFSFNWTGIPS